MHIMASRAIKQKRPVRAFAGVKKIGRVFRLPKIFRQLQPSPQKDLAHLKKRIVYVGTKMKNANPDEEKALRAELKSLEGRRAKLLKALQARKPAGEKKAAAA